MIRRPPRSTLFPYTTLFRSQDLRPGRHFPGLDGAIVRNAGRGSQQPLAIRPEGDRGVERPSLVHQHARSEEHTSELQSLAYLVCRLLLEKKKEKEVFDTHYF